MLLFAAEQLCVIAIAASTAVASKYDFVVKVANGKPMHFLNPSSFGTRTPPS
jgi:hypothetical protein